MAAPGEEPRGGSGAVRRPHVPLGRRAPATLPPDRTGIGSAVSEAFQQVGGALGVAVLGSVLAAKLPDLVGGMTLVLGASALLTLGGVAIAALLLPSPRPAESTHEPARV